MGSSHRQSQRGPRPAQPRFLYRDPTVSFGNFQLIGKGLILVNNAKTRNIKITINNFAVVIVTDFPSY